MGYPICSSCIDYYSLGQFTHPTFLVKPCRACGLLTDSLSITLPLEVLKADVSAFWNLFGTAADLQIKMNYPGYRRIRFGDGSDRVYMPVIPEDTFSFERLSNPPEIWEAPMFTEEGIQLNKLAWQWQVRSREKRFYSIRVGVGAKTKTIAYNNLYMERIR